MFLKEQPPHSDGPGLLRLVRKPSTRISDIPMIPSQAFEWTTALVRTQPKATFSTFDDMEAFCIRFLLNNAPVAENRILIEGDKITHNRPHLNPKYFVGTTLDWFIINIAASSIAQKTRRGAGRILIHGKTYDKKLNDNLAAYKLKDEKPLGCYTLKYSSIVPQDTLLLLYSGITATEYDGPFGYFWDEYGYHVSWDDATPTFARAIPF